MKNKILTISIIFILLSFIFINNNVFAASYDLSDYKNHVSNNNWCIIYCYSNTTFYLIKADSSCPIIMTYGISIDNNKYISSRGEFITCTSVSNPYNSTSLYSVYTFNNETNTFSNTGSYNSYNHFNVNSPCEIIASSSNIYNCWNTSTFFQQTPVPSKVIIGQTTLSEELEEIMKTAGEQATLEMGQIILIVIMTTAGLMVLLIGLKKGLTILMNGFRH